MVDRKKLQIVETNLNDFGEVQKPKGPIAPPVRKDAIEEEVIFTAPDVVVLVDESGEKKHADDVHVEVLQKMSEINESKVRKVVFNSVPCMINGSVLEPIRVTTFGAIMAEYLKFYTMNRGQLTPMTKIPDNIISACYNHQDFGKFFPSVRRVTMAPLFMSDGTIQSGGGYIEEHQVYQLPGQKVELMDSLDEAIDILKYPFKDFIFTDAESEGNAWSYFFTMLLQMELDSYIPMFLFTSPTPGTGKGLLLKSLHKIVEGRNPKMLIWPTGNNKVEALEKKISSALIRGAPVYYFDNIKSGSQLRSDLISQIATGEEVDVRILFKTDECSVDVRSIFCFTGNNISLSEDLRRRIQIISIDTNEQDPSSRRFDIDLEDYIAENRQLLLNAAMTVLHEWHLNGRHQCQQIKGTFQKWSNSIGGIIEFCNGKFGAFHSKSQDLDGDSFHDFIELAFQEFGTKEWEAQASLPLAMGEKNDGPLIDMIDEANPNSPQRWLGRVPFAEHRNKVYIVKDSEGNDVKVKFQLRKTKKNNRYFFKILKK